MSFGCHRVANTSSQALGNNLWVKTGFRTSIRQTQYGTLVGNHSIALAVSGLLSTCSPSDVPRPIRRFVINSFYRMRRALAGSNFRKKYGKVPPRIGRLSAFVFLVTRVIRIGTSSPHPSPCDVFLSTNHPMLCASNRRLRGAVATT